MQPQRRNALYLFLVGVAAAACTDQPPPTAASPGGVTTASAAAAGSNNQKVKVKTMQLSSNTLRIDGPAITGQLSIGNSGLAIPTGVVVRAEVTQGAASKQAVNGLVQCSPAAADAGKLPTGTCDMTFNASASNSGTGPALVPGSATFILHVIQTSASGEIELANRSVLVNLVSTPSITALTVTPTPFTIEGPAAPFSATLQNPANSLQGVSIQAWIVQGSTRRAAGTALLNCGSAAGVLPTGTCSASGLARASNNGVYTPSFVAGVAVLELYLIQNNGGVPTPLDTATVDINLTRPIISLLTLSSSIVEINGPVTNYTVKLSNEGGPVSNIALQGELVQTQPAGLGTTTEVSVAAGGTLVTCGGAPGLLPSGICTMQFAVVASTSASGTGTIQPGPATFVLHLKAPPGTPAPYEWDISRTAVTLTSPAPTLTSVVPASTNVVLNPPIGLATRYTATISNPGVARKTVVLQTEIRQGTVLRGAGGFNVRCGGNVTVGLLPAGSCIEDLGISAYSPNDGLGTLVPGPATLEVTLSWFDGTSRTVLDKKIVDITLVSGATITNITVPEPSILIGEETSYTATFNNPFASTLSEMGIQGYLDQGSLSYGAGGTTLTCTGQPQGQLAPGTCTVSFTINTRNTLDTPPWQEAPATFRLQLLQRSIVLDEKTFTVGLYRLH